MFEKYFDSLGMTWHIVTSVTKHSSMLSCGSGLSLISVTEAEELDQGKKVFHYSLYVLLIRFKC